MYITSRTLRSIAWSALAVSAARAQYIIENLSFGQKDGQISPNLRAIPHWSLKGGDYEPDLFSDRIILTPPYPGNKRGAIWSEDALHHTGDWTAELQFRVSGMERGGGNLQIWYTRESQKNDQPHSLYTAPKFDGLVLVVDQYEGRGGSVRGFLNDGSVDIKANHDPDTLAFGQCNFAYRNLGKASSIKLHHANGVFEVTVDGRQCFSTDKVKLPEGYHFGISASSAENPDSFEIFKFLVSTTNAHTREEPNRQRSQQQQAINAQQQAHEQQTHQQQNQQQAGKKSGDTAVHDIPQMLSDVLAGSIKSQQDQFADLHNRIQIISHRINDMYDILEKLNTDYHNRHNDLMTRVVSTDDKSAAMLRNVEKVERTTMETLRDLESKDFKNLLDSVHNAIQNSHNSMSAHIPASMAESKSPPISMIYMNEVADLI
jgi:mannose-binding lectin 1